MEFQCYKCHKVHTKETTIAVIPDNTTRHFKELTKARGKVFHGCSNCGCRCFVYTTNIA